MHAGIRVLRGKLPGRSIFLLGLVLAILCGTGNAWSAPEQAGRAGGVSGTVTTEREGAQQPLKPGDPVFLKDRIRAEAGSSVEIILLDESRVKLAENTTLEITEYIYNPAEKTRSGLVSLMSGKARFLAADLQEFKDKRFRVQTQTAVIGSRDTDFIVFYQPGRDKDIAPGDEGGCRDGLVEAFSIQNAITALSRSFPDKPVLLTPNMLVQICGNNPPTPPRFANPAERARLLGGLEQIGNVKTPILSRPHEGPSPQLSDFMGGMGGGGEGGGSEGGEELIGGGVQPTNPAFGPTASTLIRRGEPVPVTRPTIPTTPTTTSPVTTRPPTTIPPITTTPPITTIPPITTLQGTTSPGLRSSIPAGPRGKGGGGGSGPTGR